MREKYTNVLLLGVKRLDKSAPARNYIVQKTVVFKRGSKTGMYKM